MFNNLFNEIILPFLIIFSHIIAIIIPLFICVALLIYAERKVIAAIQLRRGPNVVGPFGIFQPIADAIKLLTKENIIPRNSNKIV